MHVGFTGTQVGMTEHQRATLRTYLTHHQARITAIHHGDCLGADVQAHDVAGLLFIPVHLHPPDNNSRRAHSAGAAVVHDPLPYLDRNRAIVAACAVLVATPRGAREERRSGTWATVRAARQRGLHLVIIEPGGNIRHEAPHDNLLEIR